jgi:hypothetical protein
MIVNFSSRTSVSDFLASTLAVNQSDTSAADGAVNTESQASQKTVVEGSARSATVSTATSSSIMAGSFFDRNYARSEYLEATIGSRQQDQTFYTRMNSLVSGLSVVAQI